jgi:hypothetical protein
MKNMMRSVGKTLSSGDKSKEQRVLHAVRSYLAKTRALLYKPERSKEILPIADIRNITWMVHLTLKNKLWKNQKTL